MIRRLARDYRGQAHARALGEELGWRGFALPALQTRYNALTSCLGD